MQPGEYQFNTQAQETMEILSGDLEVLLPDSEQWQTVSAGESFAIPENSAFTMRVNTACDYCCSFH